MNTATKTERVDATDLPESLRDACSITTVQLKRLPIDDIVVYERHRKDLGDIEALAADIDANGLINPITINHDNELLAGERRLAAVNHLGWDKIDCAMLSPDDDLDIEWSENEMRKGFTVSERTAINKAKREKLEVEAEARMKAGVKVEADDPSGTCHKGQDDTSRTNETAAKMSGLGSARTATKAENVVEKGSAAVQKAMDDDDISINLASQFVDAVPSKAEQAAIVKEGKPAIRRAVRGHDLERRYGSVGEHTEHSQVASDLAELDGQKFVCLLADPPWCYDNQATRAATDNHYDTMTVDELCEMPVAGLVADNAHLHLWTTNCHMMAAHRVLDAWGFKYKTMFTWVKPAIGLGNYWRNSTEHMLLGVRGSAPFADQSSRNWGEWARTRHSEKPGEVRQLIEKVSPSPRLELFGRKQVEGWTVFGDQVCASKK